MRKIKNILSIAIIFTLVFSMVSYADEEVLLQDGQKVSYNLEAADPRSFLVASRIASITNNEDGTLRAYGQIIAHYTLDYACISLYLDRYDPNTDNWVNLSYQDVEFTLGEGDNDADFMGNPSVSYTLTGEEIIPGYYYRLRGAFIAKKDGRRETLFSETDGVLLTDIK